MKKKSKYTSHLNDKTETLAGLAAFDVSSLCEKQVISCELVRRC